MNRFWGILFGVVIALEVLIFPFSYLQGWWMPRNVNVVGGQIDTLFYGILAITAITFVAVEAVLVYALFKYPAVPGRKVPYIHSILSLEVGWSLATGVILVAVAVWQVDVWAEVKYPSRIAQRMTQDAFVKNEVHVMEVSARQWEWRVRYPAPERVENFKANAKLAERFSAEPAEMDIRGVNEVHVWKGVNVIVQLRTQDVIHSFFLPNLRVKQDALPGKIIPVWFQPIEANTAWNEQTKKWEDGYDEQKKSFGNADRVWELACAEYCGSRHSLMRGKLFVHENQESYLKWLAEERKKNEERQGEP